MKVFHYSHVGDWRWIKNGSWRSNYKPGLGASRRVGQLDMEAWNTCAAFALLDPCPKTWTENPHFVEIWSRLRNDIGQLLLEIDVDQDIEKHTFVVDRGLIQGFLDGSTNIPKKYQSDTRKEAEHKYISSKIPLQGYLERFSELNYSLPEVLITEDVPFDKIQVSSDQPFLAEYLSWDTQTNLYQLEQIPELLSWREAFRVRMMEQAR